MKALVAITSPMLSRGLALFIFAGVTGACSSHQAKAPPANDTPLPSLVAPATYCTPADVSSPPTLEAWAAASDVVLEATVTGIHAAWSPARFGSPVELLTPDQCHAQGGVVGPVQDVGLANLRILFSAPGVHVLPQGTLGLAGGTAALRVGSSGEPWVPAVRWDADGTPHWLPASAPGRVEAGQRIIVAAYFVPSLGEWNLRDAALLQVHSDGTVTAQAFPTDCPGWNDPSPSLPAGITEADVLARLASVDPTDPSVADIAQKRRAQRTALATSTVEEQSGWFAARCDIPQ